MAATRLPKTRRGAGAALCAFALTLVSGDLPAEDAATGRSLFDRLTLAEDGSSRELPYPFARLLAQIVERSGFDDGADPLAEILIPRGRSLHREAASPDYYRFPRVVVALDRDPGNGVLVRNRLFLGYQERAESIEVISYNEAAGRFEFQAVDGYREGAAPRVSDASRELCSSCHQNQAPIFPRPRWRETNFNREVAARIGEYHQSYQGIGTASTHADADRFDFATDQASLLQAYQRVWREGCLDEACRANLFLLSILRRIEPQPRAAYRWTAAERALLMQLEEQWPRRWPDGMPVASADIPDLAMSETDAALLADFNPATPREPLAHWSARTALLRTLEGLADQFLPSKALARLRQLSDDRAVEPARLEMAVNELRQDPAHAALFADRPIPGSALLQALIGQLDSNR